MAQKLKNREKLVTLVTTEILTPYKAGEVFSVPEKLAQKLLNAHGQDQFGRSFTPKVRLFNEDRDGALLLNNNVLNQQEHNKLLRRLHPELVDEDFDEDEDDEPDTSGTSEFDQIIKAEAPQQPRRRGRPAGSRNKK